MLQPIYNYPFSQPLAITYTPLSQSLTPSISQQSLIYQNFLLNLTNSISLLLSPSKKIRQEVICYLLQPSSSVLCFQKPNNLIIMVDIGCSQIIPYSLKYQVAWNLQKQHYLIIREITEDYVLILPTAEYKEWLFNNLITMKLKSDVMTTDDNQEFTEPFSLFKKYSKISNLNNHIRYNQLLLLLNEIKYNNSEKFNNIILQLYNNYQPQTISIKTFETFLRLYYCKYGCYSVFKTYCRNAPIFLPNYPTLSLLKQVMTKQQFSNFLVTEQHESQYDVTLILSTLSTPSISYYQFCKYIFSKSNKICRTRINTDEMNYPLNSYYCLSSHNSYLIGNQLTSKSKRRRYIEDLQVGYRCIELDVHDSSIGLVINHKYTFTSSILFEDVIIDINRFSNSCVHTPIILSIETNCKPMGRFLMANIMIKYFGNKIVLVDKTKTTYPIMKNLMNRIILKGHVSIDEMNLMPKEIAEVELLRSLTGIYKSSKSQQFHSCVEYISCNSSGLETKVKDSYQYVLNRTKKGWMRVYPNGTNFFSQNFNPILGLQMGVQMIAINSQNNDIWKLILQSYFQQTHDIYRGYSIKSPYLIQGVTVPPIPIKLIVQVISANGIRFANKSFNNYYVKMCFFGSQQDSILGNNNQLFIDATNCVSGEEGVFTNSVPIVYTLSQPSFGFVVFQIPQYGRAAIALKSIKTGYHTIQLLDDCSKPILYSSLLIKTQFSY